MARLLTLISSLLREFQSVPGQLAQGNLNLLYKWYQMSVVRSNSSFGSRPEFGSREIRMREWR